MSRLLVLLLLLLSSLPARAEPGAMQATMDEAGLTATEYTLQQDNLDDLAALEASAWAADMREVRLGEDGVEDEIMPIVLPGEREASEASERDPAPDQVALRQLLRNAGLVNAGRVQTPFAVLENQVVVLSGMGSEPSRPNEYASELACTPVLGSAAFLLVHRQHAPGSARLHELAFFTPELWATFTRYMRLARGAAEAGGGGAEWATRIHWDVLPTEQRVPFVLKAASLRVVARPRLVMLQPS